MDIFNFILHAVMVIVSIVFFIGLFMENKSFKKAILIELVTSISILIINIIILIMKFYMEKSIIITVTGIFLWLIMSIYLAKQYMNAKLAEDMIS